MLVCLQSRAHTSTNIIAIRRHSLDGANVCCSMLALQGKNAGVIFSRLWTQKFMKFGGNVWIFAVCNAISSCLYHPLFWRHC